jgi:hypothetical protein
MTSLLPVGNHHDDPRKLRDLLQKAGDLARHYDLTSVMVGVAGSAEDRLFPEMVDYVGSALRVDDAIVRLTRDRVVVFIADADRARAEEIVERLMNGFRETFTPARDHPVELQYFEVTPERNDLSVREVLPSLFDASAPTTH